MASYIKATVRADLFNSHIALAKEPLKKFMVAFTGTDDWPIGSGTLVKLSGFEGILTAHHVASKIFRLPSLGMCIVDKQHSLTGPTSGLEHIPVGASPSNAEPEAGPDLSFLIIRDSNLLRVLQEQKSFYRLEQPPSLHPVFGNDRMWAVTGTEGVSSERHEKDGVPLTTVQQFIGGGRFQHEYRREGDFDYLRLQVPSGDFEFPDDYQGISGGGFWLLPMEIDANEDPKTIRHREPVLAGVEFAQLPLKDRERILVGHGPDSIYRRVPQSIGRCIDLGFIAANVQTG
jgi:hypothetical protein